MAARDNKQTRSPMEKSHFTKSSNPTRQASDRPEKKHLHEKNWQLETTSKLEASSPTWEALLKLAGRPSRPVTGPEKNNCTKKLAATHNRQTRSPIKKIPLQEKQQADQAGQRQALKKKPPSQKTLQLETTSKLEAQWKKSNFKKSSRPTKQASDRP